MIRSWRQFEVFRVMLWFELYIFSHSIIVFLLKIHQKSNKLLFFIRLYLKPCLYLQPFLQHTDDLLSIDLFFLLSWLITAKSCFILRLRYKFSFVNFYHQLSLFCIDLLRLLSHVFNLLIDVIIQNIDNLYFCRDLLYLFLDLFNFLFFKK